MATVYIPPLLQKLTGGLRQLEVPAETVFDVVIALERSYPGIKSRLMEGEQIRPGIAIVVDSEVSNTGLNQRLLSSSEVHFLPALSGG